MKSFRFACLSAVVLTLAISDLASSPAAFAQQARADAIVGLWEDGDGSVKLDMIRRSGEFQAHLLYGNQVVESDNVPFKKDEKNPDPALRSRSLKNIRSSPGFAGTTANGQAARFMTAPPAVRMAAT